jgi:hypothetical protein
MAFFPLISGFQSSAPTYQNQPQEGPSAPGRLDGKQLPAVTTVKKGLTTRLRKIGAQRATPGR